MFKSLSTLCVALALSAAAQAAPVALNVTINPNTGKMSAGLSTTQGSQEVTHTQGGYFKDEFLFSYDGFGTVNAWLNTSADSIQQRITFEKAYFQGVDGSELSFDTFFDEDTNTRFSFGSSPSSFFAKGDYLFIVEGWAGGEVVSPGSISASYSGGINVTPQFTQVPEPASLALVLASLGAVGLASRRRSRKV